MQFLSIHKDTTLLSLSNQVGARNVDAILNANSLTRQPNIGKAFDALTASVIAESMSVDRQRKASILNTMTSDSDIFEMAALLDDIGWMLLSNTGTMPGMLKIPETISIPDSVGTLGNGQAVKRSVYDKAMAQLLEFGAISPVIFNEYSSSKGSQIVNTVSISNPLQWFKLPWGKITLYSSLSGASMDFPVYPDGVDDSVQAVYDQMPDMLYQYEPWQIYKGSGPRTNTYTFDMHRDMWSGDHRDGKCNELIRFCEANCYPEFKGAAVQTALVTLYISGKPLITGVMNDVKVSWDGPIGRDNFYLHCKLRITITEVSQESLNYTKVARKGIIG